MNIMKRSMFPTAVALSMCLTFTCGSAVAKVAEEAKKLFRQALELNRKRDFGNALGYFMRAYKIDGGILAADDHGLLDNVTAYLEARIEREPDNADCHFQLAELHSLRGREADSLKQYEEVIRLDPKGPLAVLARQESDKLRRSLKANAPQPRTTAATVPAPANKTSEKERELQAQVERLQERIKALQDKIKAQNEEVSRAKAVAEKATKDLKELREKAEKWHLYYRLYFANPQNYQRQ